MLISVEKAFKALMFDINILIRILSWPEKNKKKIAELSYSKIVNRFEVCCIMQISLLNSSE